MPERGQYEPTVVHGILDEGFVGHVGFSVDGQSTVLPMAYARDGELLYLHGAVANHALRSLAGGVDVCVTVTLVDGLVLARSAFHHSINYRSVMVFGRATPIADHEEKRRASRAIIDHIVPGRGADARGATDAELRATRMLRVPIAEASAKVRTGGPRDDVEDLGLGVWAGTIPLSVAAGTPVPDAGPTHVEVPAYARVYARPGWSIRAP